LAFCLAILSINPINPKNNNYFKDFCQPVNNFISGCRLIWLTDVVKKEVYMPEPDELEEQAEEKEEESSSLREAAEEARSAEEKEEEAEG